jgi:hypothetical protein
MSQILLWFLSGTTERLRKKEFRVANYCFLYIAQIQILAPGKGLMCGQIYARAVC